MFEIKDMSISIDDRYLIKNLNLSLNAKDKLAIIGEEGNGKSTLLKSMLGLCDYANITGTINKKGNSIGYLEQSISVENLDKKVYDYLFKNEDDYYNKINYFYKNLELVFLNDDIIDKRIKYLSGGEKVKIGILKLLINNYDILFLDEPTNDLDLETLKWLEQFIQKTTKPIVFVSHDETLLSKTANMILHIEQLKKKSECKHTLLKIGYDEYVEKRLRSIQKQTQVARNERREYQKQMDKYMQIMQKVEYKQNTISRANPFKGALLKSKMHSLKSQEKRMNEKELTEIPDVEESINFFFENVSIPKNKKITNIKIEELKVDKKILCKNIELNVVGNVHLCIVGKNGVGKTTLIKRIYDELKNRNDINVGYMPQEYDDILNKYEYVLDFVCSNKDKESITKARTYLGNMHFTRDEMTSKINDLSNGSKAKLFLIKLVLDNNDVLILDEPTRNVSPLSNPIIRKVLREYKGAIISISHDRKYINEVIDDLYVLDPSGLKKVNKDTNNYN